MDTDSLFLALAAKDLYDCIKSEKMLKWDLLRGKYCFDSFFADPCRNFFPWTFRANNKKHN